MSLVEGTSALKDTVEVAETLKTVGSTASQSAEIYSIQQYLTEQSADQVQSAMVTYKYVESLKTYVPQVVTGFSAVAGGTYTAVSGGLAYILATPVAFAAMATALGIGVGVGLYQVNPDFWDTVAERLMEAGEIVGNGILSIYKDGKNYIPESTIDIVKQVLIDTGAYDTSGTEDDDPEVINNYDPTEFFQYPLYTSSNITYETDTTYNDYKPEPGTNTIMMVFQDPENENNVIPLFISGESKLYYGSVVTDKQSGQTYENFIEWNGRNGVTYDGKSAYSSVVSYKIGKSDITGGNYTINSLQPGTHWLSSSDLPYVKSMMWSMIYNGIPSGGVEGLEKESGATYPDETKTIPEEYPNWANDGMTFLRPKTREIGENPTLDPDDYEEFRALPVEIPDVAGSPLEIPYTNPQDDTQDGVVTDPEGDPDDEPSPAWKRVIKGVKTIIDPNPDPDPDPYPDPAPSPIPATETVPEPTDPPVDPPTDDTGTTPAIIPPTDGLGTGLNNVYNPTKAELQEFNAFLWSNDFVDTIKKILNDPMQAVIALQMIYCTPTTSSGGTIVVGSIDTEVSSDIVTSQYVSINCGSVTIPEYFQDYTDYSPYTEVIAYLPFIGFVKLETDDIIGSTVNITYTVDVFTGCCICEIAVTKNNMSAVLYTFNGNCAVQLPLTSATHANIFGVLSGASTALMGIATGNPLMLIGGVASAGMSAGKTSIGRSGSLGSNAGAMGIKKPYLLVRRPVAYNPQHYNKYYGIPSSTTILFSSLKGFTRVSHIHVENIESATDNEKKMIEDILKTGVIVG